MVTLHANVSYRSVEVSLLLTLLLYCILIVLSVHHMSFTAKLFGQAQPCGHSREWYSQLHTGGLKELGPPHTPSGMQL